MKKVSLSSLVMFPMMMSHFVFVLGLSTKDTAFKVVMELHLICGIVYYGLICTALVCWFCQILVKESDDSKITKARKQGIFTSLKIALCLLASSVGFLMTGISIGALHSGLFKTFCFFVLLLLFITVMSRYYVHISKITFTAKSENKEQKQTPLCGGE